MPYIKQERRVAIREGADPDTAGELAFALTSAVLRFVNRDEIRFEALADVMGAIESTKHEFYRRVVAPYEMRKLDDNGDVFNEGLAPPLEDEDA